MELFAAGEPHPADPFRAIRSDTGGVLITFDDGNETDLAAGRRMEERGSKGVFFVATGNIGAGRPWISADGIRELDRMGCPVQSHGRSHRFLSLLGDHELRDELGTSKKILEDLTGREVCSLSFPGGRYDDRVIREAYELGYRHFFTSRPRTEAAPVPFADGGWLYHRFLIRTGTSRERFQRIVEGKGSDAAMLDLAYCGKKAVQSVLGHDRYQRMWEWWHGKP